MPANFHKWTFEEYIRYPAINWHTLEPYRKSPKHGKYAKENPKEPSEQMRLGTVADALILDPERTANFAVMPDFPGHHNSNIYKETKKAWEAENAGKEIITQEDMDAGRAMALSVMSHETAPLILRSPGRNQTVVTWDDAETGLHCKVLVDIFRECDAGVLFPGREGKVRCVIDMKTTRKICPDAFERDVDSFGYHGQLAWYVDAISQLFPDDYMAGFIAVENSPPYDVAVYLLGDKSLDAGRKLYRRLINELARCERESKWPGVANVCTIELPKYSRDLQ